MPGRVLPCQVSEGGGAGGEIRSGGPGIERGKGGPAQVVGDGGRVGTALLEGVRYPAVELALRFAAQAAGAYVLEQDMDERPPPPGVVDAMDDARTLGELQGTIDRVGAGAGHSGHQIGVELLAEDAGGAQHSPSVPVERSQAASEHRFDLRGDAQLGEVHGAVDAQSSELGHEERVAAGGAAEVDRQPRRDRLTGEVPEQLGDRLVPEPAECQPFDARRESGERRGRVELGIAEGAEQHDSSHRPEVSGDVAHQQLGRGPRPVQVFEDHQQPGGRRPGPQLADHGVKGKGPSPLRRMGIDAGGEGGTGLRDGGSAFRSEDLHPGSEGRCEIGIEARPPGHVHAACASKPYRLTRHGRLAHPGLARDEHDATGPTAHVVERSADLVQHVLPPVQRRCHARQRREPLMPGRAGPGRRADPSPDTWHRRCPGFTARRSGAGAGLSRLDELVGARRRRPIAAIARSEFSAVTSREARS